MTLVYIAAPYITREEVKEHVCRPLRAMGMEPRAGWLNGTRTITPGTIGACADSDDGSVRGHALGDLGDLAACRAMLHVTGNYCVETLNFSDGPSLHTGGRHTELGYALALSIPVVVLGEPENIFQRALTTVTTTLSGALLALSEESEPRGPRYPAAEVKLSDGALRADREVTVNRLRRAIITAGCSEGEVQQLERALRAPLTNSELVTVASRWVTVR